jgi:hypothetical protein
MTVFQRHRDGIAMAAALVAPLVVCAILIPFRDTFAPTAAALVLVAVIVAVATTGTRIAGFVASLSAAVWFDFFLTEPYEHFTISHRTDIEIAVSLLVVGLIVTELAARSRHHHQVATDESDHLERVYEVGQLTASGAPAEVVIDHSCATITDLLQLQDCGFEDPPFDERPAQLDPDGHVRIGTNVWPVATWGLPSGELDLAIRNAGQIVGRFRLTPTIGLPISLQRRHVALTISDLVGAAINADRPTYNGIRH